MRNHFLIKYSQHIFVVFLMTYTNIAFSATQLIAPEGDITDSTPVYEWTSSANIGSYKIGYTDSSGAWQEPTVSATDAQCPSGDAGQTCTYALSDTLGNGSNTWYVLPEGLSWSSGMAFTVSSAPPVVGGQQIAPEGDITDSTPVYEWTSSANIGSYKIGYTDSSGAWQEPTVSATDAQCPSGDAGQTCTYALSDTLGNGSNTWYVLPEGLSWSSGMAFTVSSAPPVVGGQQIAPEGDITDSTPVYEWTSSANIGSYKIGYTDSSGAWQEPTVSATDAQCPSGDAGQTCTYTLSDTLGEGSYTWYVLPTGLAWSDGLTFTIVGTVPPSTHRYVDPQGSNTGNGSSSSPWKEIQHAIDEIESLPSSPITLHVKSGTYREQVIISNVNGLTILGEDGAVIDGSATAQQNNGNDNNFGLITATDVSNFTIDNIDVINSDWNGIMIKGEGSTIVIENCNIDNTRGSGILVEGNLTSLTSPVNYSLSDVEISYNVVNKPQQGVWNDNGSGNRILFEEDITVSNGVEDFRIHHNLIEDKDNYDAEIARLNQGEILIMPIDNDKIRNVYPLAIDAKEGVKNGRIYNNTIRNIPSGGIYVDGYKLGVLDIQVYRNSIKNVITAGILVAGEIGGKVGTDEAKIVIKNNIVSGAESGIDCSNGGDVNNNAQKSKFITFKNNVIHDTAVGMTIPSQHCQGDVNSNIISIVSSSHTDYGYGISYWADNNALISFDNNCFHDIQKGSEGAGRDSVDNPIVTNTSPITVNFETRSNCSGTGLTVDASNIGR